MGNTRPRLYAEVPAPLASELESPFRFAPRRAAGSHVLLALVSPRSCLYSSSLPLSLFLSILSFPLWLRFWYAVARNRCKPACIHLCTVWCIYVCVCIYVREYICVRIYSHIYLSIGISDLWWSIQRAVHWLRGGTTLASIHCPSPSSPFCFREGVMSLPTDTRRIIRTASSLAWRFADCRFSLPFLAASSPSSDFLHRLLHSISGRVSYKMSEL